MENQPAIYECDVCRKHFYREDNYNDHKTAHDKGFDCDVCKKPHNCLEDLVLHIERVHAGIECDICQKPFSCVESLVAHIETQHNPQNTTGKYNKIYLKILLLFVLINFWIIIYIVELI